MRTNSVIQVVERVAVAALLAWSCSSQGADEVVPASFGPLDEMIASLPQPTLDTDVPVVGVYCLGTVSTTGVMQAVRCFERENKPLLAEQTAAAFEQLSMNSARVDGQAVPVRMSFRVVYSNMAPQPPVLVLPNLGQMQKQFGYHYSAPQERLDNRAWFERYAEHNWSEGQLFFKDDAPVTRVLALVDEAGEVASVRRLEAPRAFTRDAVEVEKLLRRARFIPGFAEGQPQTMQYVAVIHHP